MMSLINIWGEASLPRNSLNTQHDVYSVKFIARKRWFVAGTCDGFIHVYKYETRILDCIKRFRAYSSGIIDWGICSSRALIVHPTLPYLLSTREEMKLWDWGDGWKCIQKFGREHTDSILQVAFGPNDCFASVSSDHTIKLWCLKSPTSECTLCGHSDKVNCLDFVTHDGQQYLISGSQDCTAKVWALKEKECVQTMDVFMSPVVSVISLPDTPYITTGSADGTIHLWSSANFRLERILSLGLCGPVWDLRLIGPTRVVIQPDNYEISAVMDIDIGSEASSSAPSNELIQVDPQELRFPVAQEVSSTLEIRNVTDHHVAFCMWSLNHAANYIAVPNIEVLSPQSMRQVVVTRIARREPVPADPVEDVVYVKSTTVVQGTRSADVTYDMFGGTRTGRILQPDVELNVVLIDNSKIIHKARLPWALDVHPTMPWIMMAQGDYHIRIWNYETQIEKPIAIKGREVTSAKFIAHKQWIMAGCSSGIIYVYRYEPEKKNSVEKYRVLQGHSNAINSLAVHSTESCVLSASKDGKILIWDYENEWKLMKTLDVKSPVQHVAFSPKDTNMFASAQDKTVKIWNWQSNSCKSTLSGHSDLVLCLDYFSQGDKLFLITGSRDKTAKIWDCETGSCVRTLEGHTDVVNVACCHPDLLILITGSLNGSVRLWDWSRSTMFRYELIFDLGEVYAIASLKGKRIAIGNEIGLALVDIDLEGRMDGYVNSTVAIMDSRNDTDQNMEELNPTASSSEVQKVSSIVAWETIYKMKSSELSIDVHPTETWMAITSDKYVHIWDYHTREVKQMMGTKGAKVRLAKFIARKQWVIAGATSGFIFVYDYDSKKEIIHVLSNHTEPIRSLAIHGTEPFVLSASVDGKILLWDYANDWHLIKTFDAKSQRLVQVAFNPKDTNIFASAQGKTVKVWDRQHDECQHTLDGHSRQIECFDYFSGGDFDKLYIITGSQDKTAKIWNCENASCVQTLEGHAGPVRAVCYHQNLSLLITGCSDGSICLWNSTTFRLEHKLNFADFGLLSSVACLKGPKRIAIRSKEGLALVDIDIEDKKDSDVESITTTASMNDTGPVTEEIKVGRERSPSLPLQRAIEGEPLDCFGARSYTKTGAGGRREGTIVGRGLMEAVSYSTGAMGPLLRKLELLLAPESRLRKRVKDGIGLLKEDLEEVSSPLVDLSMLETPSPRAKCWMEEARELSYHVEDFVDELMLMLTDAGANIRAVSRHRVGRVKIALLPAPPRRSTRVTKIAELRALVWQATERLERYQLEACCSSPSDMDMITQHRRGPALYGDAANLVGIKACKIKLSEVLTGETEQQLKVAFIVGPAGVGKTTLAKEIFGELRGKFELRAFVHASRKLDMRRLLGSILSQVQPHHQRPSVAGTVQSLIDSIQEQLRDKRYFIVIDDLWEETAWDIVRDAFPEGNNYSRIVATTENMNVALKCCGYMTDNILKMKPLGIQDSECLFFNRVFGSDQQCPDELKEVSYGIIRKCCRLPLSIIHVAGLLASMDYSGLWYHVHDRLCSILNRSHTIEEIQKKILNLSYNSLPHCLKTCLLYFNMYPESYIMWKVDLVKQWIAEGFINPAEGEDREEIAEGYFEELVNRGMVQPMKIDYNGEVLSCTVHHTIFDVINHNSKEEEFIAAIDYSQPITGLSTKARRLSFRFSSAKYAKQPARTTMSQLRSLGFFGFGKCMPPIVEFKHLRVLVLDFWGSHDGHTSLNLSRIYILFQLRYLKISGDIMVELPAKMQGLHYLETLEIDARLSAVPLDIVHLPSLFHLSLRAATKLPDGIGHIKSLNTLLYFDLRCNSEDNIRSLGQLTNLRHLHLTCSAVLSSDHLKRKLIPLAFSLGKLGNLKSLTLTPGALRTTIVFDILSGISSPSIFLQRLELLPPFCFFSSLPARFGELHKLRILKIAVKELQENDINNIAGLPSLVIFSLYVRTALTGTVIFGTMAFPALKYFRFTCGVMCLAFQVGAMHNLQRLKLCFNAHGGKNHSRVIDGIEYLLNLQEVCGRIGVLPGGDESNMRVVKLSFEDTIRKHPRCLRFNLQLVDFIEEEYPPLVKLHQRQQDEYEIEEKDCAEDNNKHTDIRRIDESVSLETPVPYSDGHQWRKYGQKDINNTKHPRGYYRCTYRLVKGCRATKTVQQQDDSSGGGGADHTTPMYTVVYYGQHTCNKDHNDGGGANSSRPDDSNKHQKQQRQPVQHIEHLLPGGSWWPSEPDDIRDGSSGGAGGARAPPTAMDPMEPPYKY